MYRQELKYLQTKHRVLLFLICSTTYRNEFFGLCEDEDLDIFVEDLGGEGLNLGQEEPQDAVSDHLITVIVQLIEQPSQSSWVGTTRVNPMQ